EGRIAGHGRRTAAPDVPELVPSTLSLRLRGLQDGVTLSASTLTTVFARDVADWFAQTPMRLPQHWLYDDLGSARFDAICQLPWYRITRAENGLLARHGEAIFDALPGELEIVELGGGSGEKLDLLLAAAARRQRAASVRLIDISGSALDTARARLDGRDAVEDVHTTQATYE